MDTGYKKLRFQSSRYSLEKRDAIYLFSSCIAQLFLWCVNPGTVDLYKYILAMVSLCFMILLLRDVWIHTEPDERMRLAFRILLFSIIFNACVMFAVSKLGGVIAFIIGVALMMAFWKISSPADGYRNMG